MNSHRPQYQPPINDPDAFRPVYAGNSLKDRLLQPSVLVSVLALLLTYLVWGTPGPGRASLWDILVNALPYKLLYHIDNWLRPSLIPRPMLARPARTLAAKHEILQRIMGRDGAGGGIMGAVSQASHRGLTSVSGAMLALKGATNDPPGLGNLDNSCYQNSILQGLASLYPLPRYLSEQLRNVDPDQRKHDASVTLRALIEDLNSTSNNGRTLWTPASLKNMSTWQQQDAQEYFSKLLDEVDKEISRATKEKHSLPSFESDGASSVAQDDTAASQHSDDSGYQSISLASKASTGSPVARNPLEGLVAQRVSCVQCGHSDGLSMIPFNCLTLSLGLDATNHDLYELLDAYSHIESIEGVECGKCTLLKVQRLLIALIERAQTTNADDVKLKEPLSRLAAIEEAFEEDDYDDQTVTQKCKVSPGLKVTSTKTKQTVIARAPQSLAIHMNRSVFDENTGFMWKNSAAVRFPLTLDLGPWCLGSAGTYKADLTSPDVKVPIVQAVHPEEEEWLLDPRKSMVAGDKGQSKMAGPIYELRAVITHFGRHENGHYICYRKFPRNSPPAKSSESDDGEDDVKPHQAESRDDDIELSALSKDTSGEGDPGPGNGEIDMDWWRLSDETVYKVDEAHVLNQGGVFMLFYDCVEQASALVTPDQGWSSQGSSVPTGEASDASSTAYDSIATEEEAAVSGALPAQPHQADDALSAPRVEVDMDMEEELTDIASLSVADTAVGDLADESASHRLETKNSEPTVGAVGQVKTEVGSSS